VVPFYSALVVNFHSALDRRDLVGRKGSGNYQGIALPCWWPGTNNVTVVRLRLDFPPVDPNGKVAYKYLTAPGTRNRLYMPLEDPAFLADPKKDAYITEGEKKGLALHQAAENLSNGTGPAFMAIALFGVWSWRGIIGITTDAHGNRVEQKGPIPDLDRVVWQGRRVFLIFDTNVLTSDSVKAARNGLAHELESRGATVYLINLPPTPDVNGVDDYLYQVGLHAFADLVQHAARYDWKDELARTEKGKIMGTLGNALTALRMAPGWHGVLGFNEFSLRLESRKPTPWGDPPGDWNDHQDLLTTEWLEHQGVRIPDMLAGKAALTVARQYGRFHPVREYLNHLKWDGTGRIDDWLGLYLGVDPGDPADQADQARHEYTRAIGACWLISGVARVRHPGCRVDHTLILEGPQGICKSTTFSILGGPFFSDDMPDLTTKDAQMATAGVWVVELSELDAMGRAEVSKIKAFLSRSTDHFRPPYGRHMIWVPRQCIFGGTVNLAHYLKDETGGRRFWPVRCGKVNFDALARDRDQLWAEAVVRYEKGEHWWLEKTELVAAAEEEQARRFLIDPWEPVVEFWLLNQTEVTTADVLAGAIKKDTAQWSKADEMRAAGILDRLGWHAVSRPRGTTGRRRLYRPSP
jgi:predicted P-loop ATPase